MQRSWSALKAQGITELAGLAHAEPEALKTAGIGDAEAGQVLADAKTVYYGQVLRGMGIPAVSLKKYLAAGFTTPDAFCELKPETLSERTGMSLGTVQKHVAHGLQGTRTNRRRRKSRRSRPRRGERNCSR